MFVLQQEKKYSLNHRITSMDNYDIGKRMTTKFCEASVLKATDIQSESWIK